MNLKEIRAEFPVLARFAYLNAGTFGPLPRVSLAAQLEQHHQELNQGRAGVGYYERMQELRISAREGIAQIIGSMPENVVLTRSTGEGCAIAVNGLDLSDEDEVITTDVEHYGLLGPLAASSAKITVVEIRDRSSSEALEAIRSRISPQTKLIALSHVAWSTGHLLPVAELASTGIPVLVDGAQSAGAIPVDVQALGCDFYTVSGQKWLLGPDATGGLFIHPRWTKKLFLSMPSYFGRVDHDQYGVPVNSPGATRFDPGAVSLPSLAGLNESLRFHTSLGDERFVRARNQAEVCRNALLQYADLVTEPGHANLVSFKTAEPGQSVVARLAESGVLVREIPESGWVRVSVGFWTSDGEIERLVDAL